MITLRIPETVKNKFRGTEKLFFGAGGAFQDLLAEGQNCYKENSLAG